MLFDPVNQGAGVATGGPEFSQRVFGGLPQLREDQFGAIAILDVGGIDHHFNEMARGIYSQMFTALAHVRERRPRRPTTAVTSL
jgi:hypothetical protein